MAKPVSKKEIAGDGLDGTTPVPPVENTQNRPHNLTGGELQVVEFLLGREHYAIDLFDVREVVEYTSITQLPNTPSFMKGIIDLRGEITTIIDLKERLNIVEKSNQPIENSRIIVLDEKITKAKTGILVDDVLAVSTFERGDIDSTSASEGRKDAAILGIIKKQIREKEQARHQLIIWIDIRHLLSDVGGEV